MDSDTYCIRTMTTHQENLLKYFRERVSLNADQEKLLAKTYKPFSIKKKSHFLQQGDSCVKEAFVAEGAFRVYYADHRGLEHVLYFAFENWWVGDPASFSGKDPCRFSIQAISDSVLMVVNPEEKEALYQKIPGLERMFRIIIQKHLSVLQKRFLLTVSATAADRYAELIERCPDIEQLVPQYQIASYLGILPESLSRIKKELMKGL